jgi:multimeric flavodoxin WrbA
MKKVLVISSSLRSVSNSDILADSFIKGAQEKGNDVKKISLKGFNLKFCLGCLVCQKKQDGKCIQQDDMNKILPLVQQAEVLVFVTPIYYYGISGQLKTFLDRCNPLFGQKNSFKEVYVIGTCADDSPEAFAIPLSSVQGWISCFDDVSLKGVIKGIGINEIKEAQTKTELLEKAYLMGRNI